MRRLQIGVIGKATNLEYRKEIADVAEEVGAEIARRGYALFYGADRAINNRWEEDEYVQTIAIAAANGAKRYNGLTVGIMNGRMPKTVESETDIVIPTGFVGIRYNNLWPYCDAIIGIGAGYAGRTMFNFAFDEEGPRFVPLLVNRREQSGEAYTVETNPTEKEAVDRAEIAGYTYLWRWERKKEYERARQESEYVAPCGYRDELAIERELKNKFIKRMIGEGKE